MNKDKNIISPISIFAVASILLTLMGVIIRCFSLRCFYDADIGYFQNAPLPILMNIFFLVCVIGSAIATFILEHKGCASQALTRPVYFKCVSGLCALALAALAVFFVTHSVQEAYFPYFVLSCIVSAVYFALLTLKKVPTANAVFALVPAVLCVFVLAVTYFDIYTPMNAPHKVLMHLACISSMLGFLAESRALADEKKKKTYLFFVSVALFFTGVTSIPSVLLFTMDYFPTQYIYFNCIFLVFFIYFAARALTLIFAKNSEEPQQEEQPTEDIH